jgi:hypothetical protein
MDPRLQEMLDHYEIRKTLAEYCHATDRADEAQMVATYTDDGFDDHGLVKAPAAEYCKIMVERICANTTAMSHILGQSLIKVDGDSAGAETFFLAFFRLPPNDNEPDRMHQLVGRFVDTLERVGGKWRVKYRTCVRDTSITQIVERDDYAGYGFVEGTRDASDLGAAMIGLVHR